MAFLGSGIKIVDYFRPKKQNCMSWRKYSKGILHRFIDLKLGRIRIAYHY